MINNNISVNFPVVTIVIPTYNSKSTIRLCVEACLQQDYSSEKVEVIVVDDGSTDDTKEVLKGLKICYIWQENAGPASARNKGWRNGKGEIVCFTDSDCVPENDWIINLVREFESPEIGAVGGTYDIENPASDLAKLIHYEILQRHKRLPRFVDYLGGFNLAFRKKVLEELNGFDQSFPTASAEDNDISYRAKKAGYKLCFTNDAVVGHHHPERLGAYLKSQYRHGYWRMKLYKLHGDMIKGDKYAGPMDLMQPPLAVASLAMMPLLFWPAISWLPFALLSAGLFLSIWNGFVLSGGKGTFLKFGILSWIRSFARGLGLVMGAIKFRPLIKTS